MRSTKQTAPVRQFDFATLVAPSKVEWESHSAGRLPSQPLRSSCCINNQHCNGYGLCGSRCDAVVDQPAGSRNCPEHHTRPSVCIPTKQGSLLGWMIACGSSGRRLALPGEAIVAFPLLDYGSIESVKPRLVCVLPFRWLRVAQESRTQDVRCRLTDRADNTLRRRLDGAYDDHGDSCHDPFPPRSVAASMSRSPKPHRVGYAGVSCGFGCCSRDPVCGRSRVMTHQCYSVGTVGARFSVRASFSQTNLTDQMPPTRSRSLALHSDREHTFGNNSLWVAFTFGRLRWNTSGYD